MVPAAGIAVVALLVLTMLSAAWMICALALAAGG